MWKIKDPELKAKVNQFFTVKIGERSEVRIGRWGIVGCDGEWVGEIQTQIQGFKELPEPYKKGGLNGNHTDTLRADPI